jgi:serine phosphatase RsbU (regulator of sigma subunit)
MSSVRKKLKDFSVEWHPRDTIGGDFWWSYHHEPSNTLLMALVDCAGHGVPGAMLSVLVNSQLEKIFSTQPDIELSMALLQLDDLVRKSLRQNLVDCESDDGCDGAFLRIHLSSRTLEFVGAKINLYELNSKGEVEQHKAERISLGYRDVPRTQPVTKVWKVTTGSRFILVTDGVTDQMGGHQAKPLAFGYKRLMESLASSAMGNSHEISHALLQAVTQWQGPQARRDDLTILALEI